MVDADSSFSRTALKELVDILMDNMTKVHKNKASLAIQTSINESKGMITDLTHLRRKINGAVGQLQRDCRRAHDRGDMQYPTENPKVDAAPDAKQTTGPEQIQKPRAESSQQSMKPHVGSAHCCGKRHNLRDPNGALICNFVYHPDYNSDVNIAFTDTRAGRILKAAGYNCIQHNKYVDRDGVIKEYTPRGTSPNNLNTEWCNFIAIGNTNPQYPNFKGKPNNNNPNRSHYGNGGETINCLIYNPLNNQSLQVEANALLDTGALHGDYCIYPRN